MKIKQTIQITSLLILGLFTFTSCSEKKTETKNETNSESTTTKRYPLDTCLVSGEKLGSMGEPHTIVVDGQQIKMCCDKCLPKFKKNQEKYLAMLKEGNAQPKGSEHGHSH